MGLSMVEFLGSINTMCICNCVGSCALCSMSWMRLSKGASASGGAVLRSCADTASGPLALSGRPLMVLAKCPSVMGASALACRCACSLRLVRGVGWLPDVPQVAPIC